MRWNSGYTQPPLEAMKGSNTGGNGGNSYRYWDTNLDGIGGGIGNPTGNSNNGQKVNAWGTGGLLILYASTIKNDNIIQSNGTDSVVQGGV